MTADRRWLAQSSDTPVSVASWLAPTVVIMGIMGAAMLVGAAAYNAYVEIDRDKTQAGKTIEALTELAGSKAASAFLAIDRAFALAAREYELLRERGEVDEREGHALLLKAQQRLPFVRGLGWFDESDRRVASSFGIGRTPLNIANEPNFEFHRNSDGEQAHLGKPVFSTTLNEWIVPFSRRGSLSPGVFGGVVNGVVNVPELVGRSLEAAADTGMIFALLREDGNVLATSLEPRQALGRDIGASEFFAKHLGSTESGVVVTPNPITGRNGHGGLSTTAGFSRHRSDNAASRTHLVRMEK